MGLSVSACWLSAWLGRHTSYTRCVCVSIRLELVVAGLSVPLLVTIELLLACRARVWVWAGCNNNNNLQMLQGCCVLRVHTVTPQRHQGGCGG